MVKSLFQRRRKTVVTLFILSCIFISSFVYRYCIQSSDHTTLLHQDLDFLDRLCSQHNQYDNQSLSLPPQPIAPRLIKEYDHLYGSADRQLKQSDTRLRADVWDGVPVKGAFYMMVRQQDLHSVRATMRSMEDRFNRHLNVSYPWVLLSNQRLTSEFKHNVRRVANDPRQVYFGMVDLEAWIYPKWIDSDRTENVMRNAMSRGIIDAHSLSKKQKMRYQSGLFQHHSLLKDVEYVWHIEPGTTFDCDMYLGDQDPFQIMKSQNKKIGFSITNKEDPSTIFSLFPAALRFMHLRPDLVRPKDQSIMPWLITESKFNFCSFVTDSEIISLSFLRSKEYMTYFHFLDLVGGFFYEYWADGPARTLAAAMFLKKEEVHFFDGMGYGRTMHHCPFNDQLLRQCSCDYLQNHNYDPRSCTIKLLKYVNPEVIVDILDFTNARLVELENNDY